MNPEDILNQIVLLFNRREIDSLVSLYDTAVVVSDPIYEQPLKGKEAVREDYEGALQTFPDLRFDITSALSKGQTAGGEYKMTGTCLNTGRHVELPVSFFIRLNATSLIVEERRYYDVATFERQLGRGQ